MLCYSSYFSKSFPEFFFLPENHRIRKLCPGSFVSIEGKEASSFMQRLVSVEYLIVNWFFSIEDAQERIDMRQ